MLTDTRYRKSEAVKMLERLEQDAYRKAHPMIPAATVVPTKHRDDTANGLTRCILRYLTLNGWQAERINTMGRPVDTSRRYDVAGCPRQVGALRWGKSTSTRGSADLSATIAGRSVKIEVKVGRDRQSEAQRAYARAVEQAGGLYVVARDLEQFVAWYEDHFGGKEVRDE